MAELNTGLAAILRRHEARLLADWMSELTKGGRSGAIDKAELEEQARTFVRLLTEAAQADAGADIGGSVWGPLREMLAARVGLARAPGLHADGDGDLRLLAQAAAVRRLRRGVRARTPRAWPREIWAATTLLDKLGLYTDRDVYQKSREEVIMRQQQELLELSTPVVAALGRHPRAAADRHARQRAHAGRDGEPAPADRRDRRVHRHHRHHRRAHRRHPGRAAPAQDGRRRAADGRRVHHQRHPAADRPDHRPPRRRPGRRRHQGDAGRRARAWRSSAWALGVVRSAPRG